MTDWMDDIKRQGNEARARSEATQQAIDRLGGRLWDKLVDLSRNAVERFNRDSDVLDFKPHNPLIASDVYIRGSSNRLRVTFDLDHAVIEYTYRGIPSATAGKALS